MQLPPSKVEMSLALISLSLTLISLPETPGDTNTDTWGEGTACGFVGGRMQLRPRLVSIDSVKAVSCGLFHTAAVTTQQKNKVS